MARKSKPGEHAQTFRLPTDVWQNLCRSSEANLRSRNGELVWILREFFREHGSRARNSEDSEGGSRSSGS